MIKKFFVQYKNMIFLLTIGGCSIITSLLLTHDFRIIALQLLLLICALIIFNLERQRYERELAATADLIQYMIDGKQSPHVSETTDHISSKIQYQLNHLQAKVNGYHESLLNDRNATQKLITEIAHQLRTPLVNIEAYLDLLKSSDLTEEEDSSYLEAIAISENKLSFLIQSFIKMSRFENHLIQIKKTSKHVKETVMNAVFQLYREAEKKNINIVFLQSQDIKLLHDQNWIGEAVYNILDNSVKYSPADSEIQIELTQNEMFGQISIRDYGIGIQKGEENQIFQRFYRGKNVTTQEGFGVGLYLSREIITRHNGFIKVKREDPGLLISIYLPQ